MNNRVKMFLLLAIVCLVQLPITAVPQIDKTVPAGHVLIINGTSGAVAFELRSGSYTERRSLGAGGIAYIRTRSPYKLATANTAVVNTH